MNPKQARLIKITSTIFITAAIGLELANVYLQLNNRALPNNLTGVFWLGTIAILAHGIEGVVAAIAASSRDRNPLTSGIYTFFVGFVGLQEIFAPAEKP